jgi:hypothetical protein
MADQLLNNSGQPLYDDEIASGTLEPYDQVPYYLDVLASGVNDDYRGSRSPTTWLIPSRDDLTSANHCGHYPFTNSNISTVATIQDSQASISSYTIDRGVYPTSSGMETSFSATETEILNQDPVPSTERRKKTTASKSGEHHSSKKPPRPSTKHSRRKSLKRAADLPDSPRFVLEADEADEADEAADVAEEAQPLDEQAAEELRRLRNREATGKSQQKKKKRVESLERRSQDLSAEYNCLREEKATLESERLTLRHEILQHRECGSDLINAYITASARNMVIEARRSASGADRQA